MLFPIFMYMSISIPTVVRSFVNIMPLISLRWRDKRIQIMNVEERYISAKPTGTITKVTGSAV